MATIPRSEALSSIALGERALRTPDAITLVTDTESISARDFDQLVNACAKVLTGLPTQPTFLPVLVSTNVDSAIVFHAALRSRTPVAFIDSRMNPTYLASILGRLGNPDTIVLASPEDSMIFEHHMQQYRVTREMESSFDVPDVDITDSAFVLFSSGSTGEPKGVVYDWQILDTLWLMQRHTTVGNFTEETRAGRMASVAFGAGITMMMSLTLDHQLHLINPMKPADDIIRFINEHKITNLAMSTSFADWLFESRNPRLHLENIADFFTYGEGADWSHIRKIRTLTANTSRISVSYGASEGLGCGAFFPINPEDELQTGRVPIGFSSRVLNLEFEPTAEDPEVFEVIMKNLVAKEYFESPALSAEKFRLDEDGVRRYHSKDLVRISHEGIISFVGRADDLVKINGRVVEPAESEAILRHIPGILKAIVLPQTNANGAYRLVAHIVLGNGSTQTPHSIYSSLLAQLSSHLIPAKLVKHDEIPLMATGKIDRQYLISREWPRWSEADFGEELTDHERFALEKLQVVLEQPDLHLHEDVFGSGMDSLAALEFGEIAANFGFDGITPAIFLEHRTAKTLAHYLVTYRGEPSASVVTINATGSKIPIFAFPGGGGTALSFRELSMAMGADQPIIVIEPHGLHGTADFDASIEDMAQRAADDIAELQPEGEIHLLGYSVGGYIAVATGMLLSARKRTVRLVALDTLLLADEINVPGWLFGPFRSIKRTRQQWHRARVRRSDVGNDGLANLLTDSAPETPSNTYKSFFWHIVGLLENYRLPTRPTYPVTLLYGESYPTRFLSWWDKNALFDAKKVAGTHSTLMEPENLAALADVIEQSFNAAQAR